MQWLDRMDEAMDRTELMPALNVPWPIRRREEQPDDDNIDNDQQPQHTTTRPLEEPNDTEEETARLPIIPHESSPHASLLHSGLGRRIRDTASDFCAHPPTLLRGRPQHQGRYVHQHSSASQPFDPQQQQQENHGEESAELEHFFVAMEQAPLSGATPLAPEGSMLVDETNSLDQVHEMGVPHHHDDDDDDDEKYASSLASVETQESMPSDSMPPDESRLPLSISIEREESDQGSMIDDDEQEEPDETDGPMELSAFDVTTPLTPWIAETAFTPLEASKNCHGVVHVRMLAAQRLSCPVGSMVQAIVALPPWKGRVRTEPTKAFLGPEANGVCIRWDQLSDAGFCSMVHAWNNQDTPIPTLAVDMMFQPLNVMEFTMCSLRLSCDPLMRAPGIWKRHWCAAMTPQKLASNHHEGQDPLVQLEAMFLPDNFDEEGSVDSVRSKDDETDEVGELSAPPTPVRTESVTRNVSTKASNHSGRSIGSMPSFMLSVRNPKKLHLMRVQSFFVPATCSVCSAVIVGWKRGYRCETCSIDCCSDCQLQVDLQLPCGSTLATEAVQKSIQSRMTLSSLMNVVAPVSPGKEAGIAKVERGTATEAKNASLRKLESVMKDNASIGNLSLNIVRACLFEKTLPPDTDPSLLRQVGEDRAVRVGDHYVRISMKGSHESSRTRTVQNTGKPQFDSGEMHFDVPHYGMEYRLEVIDATTDKPVGTALLTTQGLLQQQRDILVSRDGIALVSPFHIPDANNDLRKVTLELRSGVKSGFGSDFYVPPKSKSPAANEADSRPGAITGWVELDLCLSEDRKRLYSSAPIECPARPPDEFNLEIFQLHVARISALVNDVKRGMGLYTYLISWKDPTLTSLSLIVFVSFCLRFNTEYVGSLPVFVVIVTMLYLASIRRRGLLQERFTAREASSRIEADKNASVKYALHRPIGCLDVRVQKGTDIRSRDLGLPGRVGCRVYWDPLRYVQRQKEKASLLAVDRSLQATHDIGQTTYQYSANPVWDNMEESEETKRLQQLIPSEGSFFETQLLRADDQTQESSGSRPLTLQYPILQPVAKTKRRGTQDGGSAGENVSPSVKLEPWNKSPGAVVFEVRFQDVLNRLPGFDDVFGEVAVPVSKLIENREINGWFQVCESGTTRLIPVSNDASRVEQNPSNEPRPANIFLDLRWSFPPNRSDDAETEKEASIVVAEELLRSAARSEQGKVDLIGSSIGAFNTVRGLSGNIQFIQNLLGSILDLIESIRNAFNFTDPFKSSVVLAFLTVLWIFLALVPTRALLLTGGLAQYIVTFINAFGPGSKTASMLEQLEEDEPAEKENQKSPIVTWLTNAIRGLPTDEDLRKAYFWESRRVGEVASQRLATQKRSARLQRLWKAQWYSAARIKTTTIKKTSSTDREWFWNDVFAMVQGRRLLWWPTAQDFDNGEAPVGRIFLAGHAGLAGLSPLDLRELHADEIPFVTSIFGRGIEGQQKIALLLPDQAGKEKLEEAIVDASTKED